MRLNALKFLNSDVDVGTVKQIYILRHCLNWAVRNGLIKLTDVVEYEDDSADSFCVDNDSRSINIEANTNRVNISTTVEYVLSSLYSEVCVAECPLNKACDKTVGCACISLSAQIIYNIYERGYLNAD